MELIATKFDSFGASEKGEDHRDNEDTILIDDSRRLYAVADGVTLPYGGGLASRLAVKVLQSEFRDDLAEAVTRINKAVVDEKRKVPEIGSTTLTAAHLTESKLEIAHVGDSYGFVVRDSRLILSTDPQSRDGFLTNTIGEYFDGIARYERDVEPGDYVVLATDGVTAVLSLDEILERVMKHNEPRKIVEHVLEEVARRPRQYRDDRSMIVVRI